MEARPRFKLPREKRLQKRGQFLFLKEKGQRLAQGCLIFNWIERSEGIGARIGLIAPAKIGSAVIRSRVRRLLREAFRLHQHELSKPVDLVLVARPSIVGKNFADVERDFVRAMERARIRRMGT